MAAQTVEDVVRKAVSDESYRTLLLKNPTEALAGFDLTDDERRNLSSLDPSLFEGDVSDLEARISRRIAYN